MKQGHMGMELKTGPRILVPWHAVGSKSHYCNHGSMNVSRGHMEPESYVASALLRREIAARSHMCLTFSIPIPSYITPSHEPPRHAPGHPSMYVSSGPSTTKISPSRFGRGNAHLGTLPTFNVEGCRRAKLESTFGANYINDNSMRLCIFTCTCR